MGDMNDDPRDKSMSVALGAKREMSEVEEGGLYNPFWKIHDSGTGTLQYNNAWNLFDQIILSRNLLDIEGKKEYKTLTLFQPQIFRRDYLFQKYKKKLKPPNVGLEKVFFFKEIFLLVGFFFVPLHSETETLIY